MTENIVTANGIRMHYVECGAGLAVVLLHGFPDFWYLWRQQLPALDAAGFRAIAPDLRGYNRSDRPQPVADYALDTLVGDVVSFSESVAGRGCALVGHDWGGVLAWYAAARRPDVFRRLVVINAPHPARYGELLRTRPAQLWRSWYVALFQLPWLPERLLHVRLSARIRRGPRPGRRSRTQEELHHYAAVFDSPGAFRGPLHYYRAAMRGLVTGANPRISSVSAPTLLLWGDRDRYLDVRNTHELERWAAELRIVHFPNAGHWLMLDEPQHVNRELIEFLR